MCIQRLYKHHSYIFELRSKQLRFVCGECTCVFIRRIDMENPPETQHRRETGKRK